MARRLDLTDWTIDVGDSAVLARPSATAIGRQLWVTLLCAVAIGAIVWWLGMPPGSRRLAQAQARIDRLDQQADQLERQARRMQSGAGDMSRQLAEQQVARAADVRAQAQAQRDALADARPTLAPPRTPHIGRPRTARAGRRGAAAVQPV